MCDCHEAERGFLVNVFVHLVSQATEALFTTDTGWNHGDMFQNNVPKQLIIVSVDNFENIQ